jgi:hypothetical protein
MLIGNVSLLLDYRTYAQHTAIIRENYVFLVENLEVKYDPLLLSMLISEGVLTQRDKEDITNHSSHFRHNENLLSILSRKSASDFLRFVEALDRCKQSHIANRIRGIKSSHIDTLVMVVIQIKKS